MQEPNRKFYEEFASRISFIRRARNLTLAELSGGSASTAKSWEAGSLPRADQWQTVASRLGLSVSFVFLGVPKLREDFDFVAKYADEIGRPAAEPEPVAEEAGSYGTAENLRSEFRSIVERDLAAAGDDPTRLGWLLQQALLHLTPPPHWQTRESAPLKVLPRESRSDSVRRRAVEMREKAARLPAGRERNVLSQAADLLDEGEDFLEREEATKRASEERSAG